MKDVPLVLLGFGNVGRALARYIEENGGFVDQGAHLHLVAVFDRGGAAAGGDLPASELLAAKQEAGSVVHHPRFGRKELSPAEVLDVNPETILVDASPTNAETGEPGLSAIRQALERGHSAVSASKGPLVADFSGLMELARERSCRVGYSAAVGTPLPSVETVLLGLHGAGLSSFRGLFNETSNRILREMESGTTYERALENARLAGVLETDPRLDLEGWDTVFKVLILARTFWTPEVDFDSNRVTGITGITPAEIVRARTEGKKIRLLGRASRNGSGNVEIQVEPVQLESEDPLYALGPGEKGAVFETERVGRLVIRSGKAGPFATAAAIVKDVLNIAVHPVSAAV